jgi:translation initiation factor IF-1
MRQESAFYVEGTVIQVLPSKLVLVTLANDHRVLVHCERRYLALFDRIQIGMTVLVKLSASDLSHGRLTLNESKI